MVERGRLLQEAAELPLPPGALDSLIDRLGGKRAVAEMTGRKGRSRPAANQPTPFAASWGVVPRPLQPAATPVPQSLRGEPRPLHVALGVTRVRPPRAAVVRSADNRRFVYELRAKAEGSKLGLLDSVPLRPFRPFRPFPPFPPFPPLHPFPLRSLRSIRDTRSVRCR